MLVKNFKMRIVAFFVVSFCFMVAVQSQPVRMMPAEEDRAPVVWSENLGEQLAASLASPIAEIKMIALEQTLYFASLQDPEIDLSATIPVLEKMYREDPDERNRMAAMAGMYAMANDDAMIAVRSGLRLQRSNSVQMASIGALMAYFGPDTFRNDDAVFKMARTLVRQYQTTPRFNPEKAEPAEIVALRK